VDRAKPAVPFGGKYRIIDFTLSNCLHSGLRRVLVLTQYKSHSLQKHLRDGWSIFNPSIGEYITPIPPQMRTGPSWYAGTADAVYQNLYLLQRSGAERVLILSGDHIYRMDYAAMLAYHDAQQADATVACMSVPVEEAREFGVMQVSESGKIEAFEEKPQQPQSIPGDPRHALASMGIYVFSLPLLCELLTKDHEDNASAHDFGRNILPQLIHTHSVYSYAFGGDKGRVTADRYWRDVGTVDAYYEANMDLLMPTPPIDLYQSNWTIRTTDIQAPPARTTPSIDGRRSVIDNAMICSGSVISGAFVRHSIIAPSVHVGPGATIQDAILLEGVRVGAGARLRRCIIDKHVVIPPGESIGFDMHKDARRFTVSERGIVVVPRNYTFPETPVAPCTTDDTHEFRSSHEDETIIMKSRATAYRGSSIT
jgi:glucose-1-phosphate adenylyltransferase